VVENSTSLPAITGCDAVAFEPSLTARPTTDAGDSPSGLDVDLHLAQDENPNSRATSALKDAVVALPEGLVVNPSSANGLDACTPAQIGLTTAVGDSNAHFDKAKPSCPAASGIGTVEVDTPVFDDPLKGTVYLASPYQNPFGSLLSLYLVIEGHGLVIKLPGKVETDPGTGRITSSFTENPQLPVEDLKLKLFSGPLAPLRTPASCGTYSTTSVLTPWSAPQSGPPTTPSDTYRIAAGPNGAACGAAANAPSFDAGSTSPLAGSYQPFVVNLKREDGSQQFSSVTVTPPPGLLAKLAGVPYCSDAALAAAAGKSGRSEQAHPSCPAASAVGSVSSTAGAGPRPYDAPGTAYLTGPYKGAPLGLAIVTPAVAGPFDLGTIVVRVALHVDPMTTRVTAVSDPIPTILEGIPLDVRSVSIRLDRSEFTRNGTSCETSSVSGSLLSTAGSTASLQSRFQLADCRALDFTPDLKLRLKGATKRIGHPALRAVVTARPGEANIGRAQVNLPHGEFLDQGNLNKTCTRPVLMAGGCPESSVYGHARAWTPLLDRPLEGPVYLVGGFGYKLPALVAELNGQIRVLLVGRIDSGKNKGIRSTFEMVPDAPVSRFELSMKGGKRYGLLENSENLCKAKKARRRAIVRFTGQNGKVRQWKPVVTNQCGKHRKKAKKNARHATERMAGQAATSPQAGGRRRG
jgi:hypothetical protein